MTLKVGVIGAGGISQLAHLPAYQIIEDVEIIGVSDINEKLGKSISQKYGCNYYLDFRQLIEKTKVDAISICTPPFARKEIIECAAENGVSILCEKPLANSLSDAMYIKKLVEKYNIQFMMGFSLRFSDLYNKAFDYIYGGKLGEIIFANCVFATCLPPYEWFYNKNLSGGGVIIDRGSHLIDLMTWYFGIPKRIYAITSNKRYMDVEENGFVTLEHESSVSQLSISFGVNKQRDNVEIYGTACNLIVDSELNSFSFLPEHALLLKDYFFKIPKNAISTYLTREKLIKKRDMYFNEVSHFIKCLKIGEDVSPNCWDGVNNLLIIDGCYRSIEEKRPVELTRLG